MPRKGRSWWKHWVRDPIEGLLFWLFMGVIFRLLPIDRASALGGWLFQRAMPLAGHMDSSARTNMAWVLPETSGAERSALLRRMYDGIGRSIAECTQLRRLVDFGRVEVVGAEHLAALPGRPAILASGHFGNWEVMPHLASRAGLEVAVVSRVGNNRFTRAYWNILRRGSGAHHLQKGADSVRDMLTWLKAGRVLLMLVDQKLNTGIEVPFFGRPAMTMHAPARMAQRFNCPVVPFRVDRLAGTHLRVTIYPPLALVPTGDREADIRALTIRLNQMLEGWIREAPEQWWWVHRRWRKELYDNQGGKTPLVQENRSP